MKKILLAFISLIIIIGGMFAFRLFNNNINHSTVTSGLVIKKDIKPYRITLKKFAQTTNTTEEVEVIIKEENVWNLIENDRYYFVTYFGRNNDKPVLGHIEINDEFGNIYKDILSK